MNKLSMLALSAALLAGPPVGLAQDTDSSAESWSMTWTDEDFAAIADSMIGTWRTTDEVAATGEEGGTTAVVMAISLAKLSELPDALYVETARADAPEQPYRSAFLQFYRRQGEIRMRTLEIRGPGNPVRRMLIGLWAYPQYIPDVPMVDLIATLDLEFASTRGGWVGETPYPYPTAEGGAVEMTSRIRLTGDRIEVADRGFGADGSLLWGPAEGESYVFERSDPHFSMTETEQGAKILVLRDEEGEAAQRSDRVVMEYSGWTTEGVMFATSRAGRGSQPLSYVVPATGFVPGWMIATDGMGVGDWRKFILPSELGYGDRSAARGAIQPGSTLIFEAECMSVQPGPLRDAVEQ